MVPPPPADREQDAAGGAAAVAASRRRRWCRRLWLRAGRRRWCRRRRCPRAERRPWCRRRRSRPGPPPFLSPPVGRKQDTAGPGAAAGDGAGAASDCSAAGGATGRAAATVSGRVAAVAPAARETSAPLGQEPPRARARPAPPPEVALAFEAVIGTILYSPDRKLAIIDGHIVGPGDEVRGARIIDITPGAVILRDGQGRLRRLTMSSGER